MQTSVKTLVSGQAKVEIGTVTHEGRDFAALGSVLDPAGGVAVGYVSSDEQWLTTWKGERIAPLRKVSTWKQRSPSPPFSFTMSAYRATIDGREYNGRGLGSMMILRMRARRYQ